MVPIQTNTTNIIFRAPGLMDLPATQGSIQSQNPETGEAHELKLFETCWQLTPEEIEEVCKTGRVYVDMIIPALPAMCVSTFSFTDSTNEVQQDGGQK